MTEPLVDGFGRVHRDLRLSVTDRCSFRCTYCMPAEGMTWQPRDELLTFEEIERIVGLLVDRFGIDGIRITGGEPLVRAHLPVLVTKLARLGADLSMTTNGAALAMAVDDLVAAGLDRVNISLDSLDPARFAEITRRDALPAVLDGIDAAVAAGLHPVKVNVVVLRGVNDDELVDFADFGRSRGVTVRFIEFMPLDGSGAWQQDQVVTYDEILDTIGAVHPLDAVGRTGSAPAERFAFADGQGEIGVIPSVSHAFCDTCDRIRLTADGQLRTCLFAADDHDLRGPLRRGADDDELADLVLRAVGQKWAGHQIGNVSFIRPSRSMSQIGG